MFIKEETISRNHNSILSFAIYCSSIRFEILISILHRRYPILIKKNIIMNLSFENKNKVENGDFIVNGQRQPNI